jgi:hypothetical protein
MRDVDYEIVINDKGLELTIIVQPYSEDDVIVVIQKFNKLVNDMLEIL